MNKKLDTVMREDNSMDARERWERERGRVIDRE